MRGAEVCYHYFDIPQVCHRRCKKTIGSIKVKTDFCQEDLSLGLDCLP